jgi:hypothetical protein
MSKHENLSLEIAELEQKNITVDVIAVQEIWDLRYPELVSLHGYNPIIFKKRRNMRGGGVGFYVRKGLNAEIIENLSPFENKIIETLTIRLVYPNNKNVLLSCISFKWTFGKCHSFSTVGEIYGKIRPASFGY